MQARWIGSVAIAVWLAAAFTPAAAQDFDKGKSPAQIFQSDCAICHNDPRALGRSMDERALAGFLAQHYTENRDVAAIVAAYLASARRGGEEPPPRRKHRPQKKRSSVPAAKPGPAG